MRPMPFEKLPPEWRQGDDGSAPLLISTLHEAALIGILPNGKTRARRPPRVDDFGVGSRLRADPFQKIENQSVYGVGHGYSDGALASSVTGNGRGSRSGRPTARASAARPSTATGAPNGNHATTLRGEMPRLERDPGPRQLHALVGRRALPLEATAYDQK